MTLLVSLLCLAAVLGAAPRRPNILFLMADEFRHDCLGVAGHPLVRTPNLDGLARGGVRFTKAYTASPVCSPARATLFTGRYPQIHGVVTNGMSLNAGEVALPDILKRYGYASGMVGKLHLPPDGWFEPAWITAGGSGPEYREFLRRKIPGFQGVSNTAAMEGTLIGPPRTPLRIGTSALPEDLYEEAWVADRAIEFLRARRGEERPWFLFVSMLKPHSEFVIPKPYDTLYRARDMPLPATFRTDAKNPPGGGPTGDNNGRQFINDPTVLREVIAHYYGAIRLVDTHLGRVLSALDELGMSGDTIVVFTADHGNMLGERNRMFKGLMYDSSARVPLLLRAPGKVAPGAVSDAVLDTASVMPTLLDLAGLETPAGVQGRSLAGLASGKSAAGNDTAFSVLHHRMVRVGPWKLIDPYDLRGVTPELYNVERDPHEQTNLYDRPEGADARRRLESALREWWNQRPAAVKLP
jgi:arylsulfatase